MPRLPRLPVMQPDEAGPDVRQAFDDFKRARGNIPNMFRTLARRPEVMLTARDHMNAILSAGVADPALKEMAVVRTSADNRCAY